MRAGVTIVGLDSSAAMLERCRDESSEVRGRVTLHHGDVRTFKLGEQFALVTAPFRVVQHLTRIQDQLGFIESVARHLVSGGRLVFDVFNPKFERLLAADGTGQEDTPDQALPDGRKFRRTARVGGVCCADQVSGVELAC